MSNQPQVATDELKSRLQTGERLLSVNSTAERLGMSRRQFERFEARLMAHGLQRVRFGRQRKYREKTINQLIKRMAEKDDQISL